MSLSRRFLPPIGALAAFEATARLGSVTAAGKELSLTQGAVSRQLQTLETQLGVRLFAREKRRLHLTPAGAEYARQIRPSLERIAHASLAITANPAGGDLQLAILPTFGTRWLAPRLGAFARLHPEVTVALHTRISPFDIEGEGMHAAIHYGAPDWPGTDHLRLMTETVIPVCAPSRLDAAAIRTPGDVVSAPLLHLSSRPTAWSDWLAAHGVEAAAPAGMAFDQFATMAQAAIHGLGLALMPEFLIEREREDGVLVPAVGGATRSVGAYYLVWGHGAADYPPLRSFRDWLAGLAR
ncbi:MAG: LysR family transcriptional regulator [Caulobacterales bacterium]|nr:LysR family transcriptional regulator [Caulobacterales bacterium]